MKQTSNPWAKLFMLMLITASAVVLFTVTVLAKSPSSMLASNDSVQVTAVPTVPTPPPAAIYISTSHSASIDADESNNTTKFRFKRDQILRCVLGGNGKCTWDVLLDFGAIPNLPDFNVQDFEVLANGDVIFAIDRKVTLPNIGAVTPRDVIRYSGAGVFSFELVGSTIGLTKSNENIDAVAISPAGHLVISTEGTASINGISEKVHDRDLIEVIGTLGSFYFKGTEVHLTSSSEDVSSAWIDTASPDKNIYLVTKGNFSVNSGGTSLSGKKSDIFGCSPTSFPVTSCFFFSYFKGKTSGLDNQIDGISVLPGTLLANAAISAAAKSVLSSTVEEDVNDSVDAQEFAEAMSEGDPEITAEDFMDVSSQVYLPMIAAH